MHACVHMAVHLAVCSNQIATRFDCLGVTLEMPFKDCASNPAAAGASVAFDGRRCAMLGASLLDAIAYVGEQLRGVEAPAFPHPGDAYVVPIEEDAQVQAAVEAMRKARGH